MKRNVFLLAVLGCVVGVWASVQVWRLDWCYLDDRLYRPKFVLQTDRGDLRMCWCPSPDFWNPVRGPKVYRQDGLFAPSEMWRGLWWEFGHNRYGDGVVYELQLPYWMIGLPPFVLLAWRLRRWKKDTRGFEVATA